MLLRSKHYFASFLQHCAATCSIDVILARKRGFFCGSFYVFATFVCQNSAIKHFFLSFFRKNILLSQRFSIFVLDM